VQTNVFIVGNSNMLSGNNQFRGLFIGAFSGSTQAAVAVAVQDLAITSTRAAGDAGGNGGLASHATEAPQVMARAFQAMMSGRPRPVATKNHTP
jgi:hypothetical protein